MKIKMLQKNKDGTIETYYTESVEKKRVYDKERRIRRKLNRLPTPSKNNGEKMYKRELKARQNLSKQLRELKEIKNTIGG